MKNGTLKKWRLPFIGARWRRQNASESEPIRLGEAGASSPRKKILILDDDPVIQRTTSMKLEAAGFQVMGATDASEAIQKVGREKFDLILLDIDFPPDVGNGGMVSWDGFRMMQWLRGLANTEGTRFVIISAGDPEILAPRARTAGALAFFQKPIDHDRLIDLLLLELKGRKPLARLRA